VFATLRRQGEALGQEGTLLRVERGAQVLQLEEFAAEVRPTGPASRPETNDPARARGLRKNGGWAGPSRRSSQARWAGTPPRAGRSPQVVTRSPREEAVRPRAL
jgi:hypothetical protein